jgi:hypothetical protein
VRVAIPVEPNITPDGIEYMSAEREILTLLASWDIYVRECAHFAFASLSDENPDQSYYSFQRLNGSTEEGQILLHVPDDHPGAIMAKLRWGGS